ncbi:MAG: alpha/beta hydrolase [Candidatus Aminicenantaceae bacterium]
MSRHLKIFFMCFSIVLLTVGCGKKGEEPVDVVEKEAEPTITVDNAISADGVSIAYEVRGEGEPALVFIHGWGNKRNVWDAQLTHFSQKYKVVAIDLAGFGASGNNREMWTMESFGDDVVAVLDKLHLKDVILIGFSMGGPVVIEAAKQVPGHIVGIVLVDTLQNIDIVYSQENISNTSRALMYLVTEPSIEKFESTAFFFKKKHELNEQLVLMVKDVPKVGWGESLKDFFRWSNEERIKSLQKIRVPVISINSDENPTNVETFKKYVPSFEVKIIPGVGHVVFWDAPEEFNRLLEETIQEFVQMKELE